MIERRAQTTRRNRAFNPIVVPGAVFSLIIFCLVLALTGCAKKDMGAGTPQADKGVLDLSGWDFGARGPVTLEGQWEFYWHRFLAPADFEDGRTPPMTGYFPVGKFWNDTRIGGLTLPGHGYATYRMHIMLPKSIENFGIRIMEMNTSYRLWIDGRLVAEVGRPGISKDDTRPGYYTLERYFKSTDGPVEIIAQVANFHYRRGGIVDPIVVGTVDQVKTLHDLGFGIDVFLMGSILIMSLYHFGLFMLRRKDPSTLLFGLFCLFIALRRFILGETVAFMLFPDFPWELAYTMRYFSFPALPIFLAFMYSLFRDRMPKHVTIFFLAVGSVFGISVFIMPLDVLAMLLYPFMAATVLTSLYLLIILLASVVRGSREAMVVLAGFIIITLSFVNDFLFHLQASYYAVDLLSLGVFLFIFSQSIVLSMRFSLAFREVEVMSDELRRTNVALVNLDRIKDEFLANTSHELKTPIGGIIGIAESLRSRLQSKTGEPVDKDLSMIITSGRRLVTLVNDILDFSKLRHGDLRIERQPVSLGECVDVVLFLTRPLIRDKTIDLRNEIPAGVPPLWADPDRVIQILYNLVGNALKFTTAGSVTVGAAVRSGGMVEITVADTGIGIPADRLDRIFEPFEQADGSISRQFGGFGLGLSITRKLAELHGGTVSVESSEGSGSTFTVTLPAVSDGTAAPHHALPYRGERISRVESAEAQPAVDGVRISINDDYTGERVLIVDDEAVNIHMLKNHLEDAGYTVAAALNGKECLDLIARFKPDLLVLDVMMPGMSGYEVAGRLRKKFQPHELPILMLTVRNRVEDLVAGFESGANDYLVKPFHRDELLSRVGNLMAIRRSAMLGAKLDMLEYELDLAGSVQRSFMTGRERLDAMGWLEVAVRFLPLNGKVSGDYYHLKKRSDGTVLVFLADVTGHGVQAALYTAQIDLLIKEEPDDQTMDMVLEDINRKVMDNSYSRFFAAFAAEIGDTVRYSSAGFHEQLVIRAGTREVVPIGSRGKIIGLSATSRYSSGEVEAGPGDTLLFFTDGLFDIVNDQSVLLDYGDLVDMVREAVKDDASMISMDGLVDEILRRVDRYRQESYFNDDITLIGIRIKERGAADKKALD